MVAFMLSSEVCLHPPIAATPHAAVKKKGVARWIAKLQVVVIINPSKIHDFLIYSRFQSERVSIYMRQEMLEVMMTLSLFKSAEC